MELKPINNQDTVSPLGLVSENIKQKASASVGVTPQGTIKPSLNNLLYQIDSNDPFNTAQDNRFSFEKYDVKPQEVYKELNSGELVPMFDNFLKGTNNEQRFAEQQSTADKWGNGILKFGGKTLNAVAGATVGTVYGITKWIGDGSFQATYDNDFNDWLDDLNTKMEYNLPNYYTEQEKENNFGQNLGTANFWANNVLGGLSFTVGTIVSEALWAYATGGGSLATSGARVGMRAGKWFGEGAELLRATNKINSAIKSPLIRAFAKPNLPTKLATIGGNLGELVNTARFTYTSAGFEAGTEARQFMREARENYINSFQELNGRLPGSEDVADFENNLSKSANALYGFNLAIVGSSNLAVFGKFLNIKSPIKAPAKWANEALFGIGMRKGASGELEKIAATKLQKAFARAYAIGKVPVVEGLWEEGQQSVGKNTAMNWVKSGYDPKYMNNTMDIGTAFTEGLAETYGSKEGWKEIGIGMIIGLLSGTGMNLVRGQGLFAEVNQAEKANENEISLRNQYSAEKLLDRIQTANRVQAFTEAQENAEQIGDITGAELSRKSAMIAHVANAHNYDYVDQATEEVTTAVNTMDSQTLMKQYGLKTEQEVSDLKQRIIDDYNETSDSYVKHREFVENFIDEKELGGRETGNKVKEALAYELTLGEHSFNYSKELLGEIQKEIATNYNTNGESLKNALEIQDLLWSSSREVRRDFLAKQKELKQARRKMDDLEKERLSLEKIKNSREDNTSTLNRLNTVTSDIQQNQLDVQRLNTELEGVLSAAQLQNPYNNESQPFITSRDLENVDTDLAKISKLIQDYKQISPQKGYRLEGLISEYTKSKTAFTRYADLARQLSDPNLGLRGRRNIITELTSDKAPKEITIEFLRGLEASGQNTVAERAFEAAANNQAVNEVVERAQMTTPAEANSGRVSSVEDIIKNNPYLLEYVGNEERINRPTEQEIEEYRNLISRIQNDATMDDRVTRVRPNYYSKKGKRVSMTPAEITRFQELNQLMSDWRLFEGALNDEGISIADLINQEISRNQDVDQVVVQDELTPDDYVLVSTPTEATPSRNGREFRDASIIQTYENIKVRVNNFDYEFSHMNFETLLNRFNTPFTLLMQSPTEFDENGFPTKWGKAQDIDVQIAIDNQKVGGTKFIIKTEAGSVPVTITNQARIQIPINTFNSIKEDLGLDIFKQMATKNSFSDLYSLNEDGDYVQMESDFRILDEFNSVSYLPEELYQLEPKTNTFFKVNINDEYNEGLKQDYEEGKITFDQLVDSVKVYNVSGNNKIIGDLKSNQDIAGADPTFLEIRRRAAEILLKDQVAETLVTVPFTAKVKYVLLGTPNITMEKSEDGVTPKAQPISEQALDAIVDFGFSNNGALTLRHDSKSVRMDFVDKLAKKANVPVIVFKQGKFLVAYPVSLTRREANQGNEVANILTNRRLNNTQKATQINNFLVQNKISPKDFGLYYVSEDNQNMFNGAEMSPELNAAVVALNTIQDTANVEDWLAEAYPKEQLMQDAQITIDLTQRPLRSPKLIIDFSEATSTDSLTWYEQWVNDGTISEEKINEIASKLVAESIGADGRNALSRQENEIVISEADKINKAIEEIYKLEQDKAAKAKQEQRKSC